MTITITTTITVAILVKFEENHIDKQEKKPSTPTTRNREKYQA